MIVDGENYKSIWCRGKKVFIIDQTKLPFVFKKIELKK